ncbi:transcription factor SPT20 homolog [Armigeres subalbatus]|uniref:transcription factor SPT20 homolog n=1 Tax=Armigeres subalbatus TaxID=124917 RepID=UPI002ED1DF80
MWLRLFIGCCVIGTLLAEKNVTEELTTKEKRQTDHETRTVPQPANRRQQPSGGYFQDPEAAAHYFAQQAGGQLLFRPHQLKAGQEQSQELPPEYISLLQQLADHQNHAAPVKQPKHHSYDASNAQTEQYYQQQQPQQQQQQQQQHQQSQLHHPSAQQNQIQYITEEEYAQILKHAQAQNQQAAAQSQYARPAGKQESPKYRPSVQLLETGQEHGQAYAQPESEQPYRIQYKSIQPTGSVTPVPKPISSFSFEKELAKLVESNRPIAYHQAGPHRQNERGPHDGQRYVLNSQSHEYSYAPTQAHEHAPKQSIKAQYIAPFAQLHSGPKPSAAHLQVGPQKFSDSPAQKYQFITQEAPIKGHTPQQYLTEVSAKYSQHPSEKQHAGTPSPKIQYYVPKEKNLQIYYPQQVVEKQPTEQHTTQHPMKIVDAPQLQHEKPHKQIQTHRPKAQYTARDKQAEQSQQSVQKSKETETPSRSTIYVSQQTGVSPSPASSQQEKQQQHQHHKIPPKIDRPLTQEEFQALVDAGYSVVPVPVPVPVPISQYHAQQAAGRGSSATPASSARHGHGPVPQASRYYQHQIAAENSPSQVVTYLRPLHIDPFSAGVRGPNKAAP